VKKPTIEERLSAVDRDVERRNLSDINKFRLLLLTCDDDVFDEIMLMLRDVKKLPKFQNKTLKDIKKMITTKEFLDG
jgi:hypothetical protein